MKKIFTIFILLCGGLLTAQNTQLAGTSYDRTSGPKVNYYYEDFETMSMPGNMMGWTLFTTNATQTWVVGNVGAHTGVQYLRIYPDVTMGYQDETMRSPNINLTGTVAPELSFWFICPNRVLSVDSNYSDLIVSGSTNGGTTGLTLWSDDNDPNWTGMAWYNAIVPLGVQIAGSPTFLLDFRVYASAIVTWGTEYGIDDLTIYDNTVGISDNGMARPSIRTYPNPASDVLYLACDAQMQQVEILNTAGVLMSVTRPGTLQGQVPVQNLAQGLYIVKVTTTEGIYTERIQIAR